MKIVEQLEKERERERLKLTGGEPKVYCLGHRAKPGRRGGMLILSLFIYRCWLVLSWTLTTFMRRWSFVMCVGRFW